MPQLAHALRRYLTLLQRCVRLGTNLLETSTTVPESVDLQRTKCDSLVLIVAAASWCRFHSHLGGNSATQRPGTRTWEKVTRAIEEAAR